MRVFIEAYLELYRSIGPRHWWPAQSPFEMMLGAILTQNTSWANVEKALASLASKKLLEASKLAKLSAAELAPLIRSSGYYNQKARKILSLVQWFSAYDYSIAEVLQHFTKGKRNPASPAIKEGQEALRKELLSLYGIGPETADSILCYAMGLPYFVVDAYSLRWLARYQPDYAWISYEDLRLRVQSEFELYFPQKQWNKHYNEFHALLVYLAKHICTKREAHCAACPLNQKCAKNI